MVCASSVPESPEGRTISPSINRHSNFEADQVSKDFMDFLKTLHKPGREIHKQCRVFIVNMSSKKVASPRPPSPHSPFPRSRGTNQNLCLSALQELKADEMSECVQDFYQNMADRLTSHFKGPFAFLRLVKQQQRSTTKLCVFLTKRGSAGSSESVEQVMDQVEKFIMSRLYKTAFCPETTDDERKDLAVQKRIR